MPNYELIATDLDGTLLSNDMTVSQENEAAIYALDSMGVTFAVTSGRTLYEIPECVRNNPNIRYITYSNGTAIYDKERGADVLSNRISNKDAREAFAIIDKYDVLCSIHANGHAYFDKNRISNDFFERYQVNGYYKKILLDCVMTEDVRNLVIKDAAEVEAVVLFFSDDEEMAECRKELMKNSALTVTSSVEHNIELCSSIAGKGAALLALSKMLGIDKDKVIAVGDNMNDTSMFEAAGLALCTGNGSKDAKALADEVICTNEEHIADYILKKHILP